MVTEDPCEISALYSHPFHFDSNQVLKWIKFTFGYLSCYTNVCVCLFLRIRCAAGQVDSPITQHTAEWNSIERRTFYGRLLTSFLLWLIRRKKKKSVMTGRPMTNSFFFFYKNWRGLNALLCRRLVTLKKTWKHFLKFSLQGIFWKLWNLEWNFPLGFFRAILYLSRLAIYMLYRSLTLFLPNKWRYNDNVQYRMMTKSWHNKWYSANQVFADSTLTIERDIVSHLFPSYLMRTTLYLFIESSLQDV